MEIEFKQWEIIAHSLGINLLHVKKSRKKSDKKLPKEFYRNRFCAGDGHTDLPILESLEKVGYMSKGHKFESSGSILWYVTDLGVSNFRDKFLSIIANETPN